MVATQLNSNYLLYVINLHENSQYCKKCNYTVKMVFMYYSILKNSHFFSNIVPEELIIFVSN